jgi:hypothetical protein
LANDTRVTSPTEERAAKLDGRFLPAFSLLKQSFRQLEALPHPRVAGFAAKMHSGGGGKVMGVLRLQCLSNGRKAILRAPQLSL